MKYKTAVRLAVRLIGVFLIVTSLPWLVTSCGSVVLGVVAVGSLPAGGDSLWNWEIRRFIGCLLGTLIGLYLFARCDWLVNKMIPSNRPYCHECGYELTGLPDEGVCPECGTEFRQKTPRPSD